MPVSVARSPGTEAPAFPVPPDALGRGFLFSRRAAHFPGCLKYRKSGGRWSFLVGINWPSALSM